MNWIPLSNEAELVKINELSFSSPQVIFKHSTRCSISGMAKSRLERSNDPNNIGFHLLDLLKCRSLSNKVAQDYDISHESPQILIIINGKCVYHESHSGIDMTGIVSHAKAA